MERYGYDGTSKPLRTLSSMPFKGAVVGATSYVELYPTLDMHVPDSTAPGGAWKYTLKPVRDEYGSRPTYGLFYDGQRVLDPQRLLTSFGRNRAVRFDESLAEFGPGLAYLVHEDLGIDSSSHPIAFANALVHTDTPPPHSYVPKRAEVREVARDRNTPVIRYDTSPQKRRGKVDIIEATSIEQRMDEAQEHIRQMVAARRLPILALEDGSGYYANIIDNIHGQLHQIGYSSKQRYPWHVVFQLGNKVDALVGPYMTPVPHVVFGRMAYDARHAAYMRQIHQKDYANNTDGDVAKLIIRGILGQLDVKTRRDIYGSSRLPPRDAAQPENVKPFYPDQPNWVRKIKVESMTRNAMPVPPPISSLPPLPPLPQDTFASHRGGIRKPLAPREEVLDIKLIHPAPGEEGWDRKPGWRTNFLLDDDNILPGWIQQASTPGERRQRIPRPVELGWDEYGLPKKLVASRPVHYESGLYGRESEPGEADEPEEYQALFFQSSRQPIPTKPYQYELVTFGGASNIHTSYSFI